VLKQLEIHNQELTNRYAHGIAVVVVTGNNYGSI